MMRTRPAAPGADGEGPPSEESDPHQQKIQGTAGQKDSPEQNIAPIDPVAHQLELQRVIAGAVAASQAASLAASLASAPTGSPSEENKKLIKSKGAQCKKELAVPTSDDAVRVPAKRRRVPSVGGEERSLVRVESVEVISLEDWTKQGYQWIPERIRSATLTAMTIEHRDITLAEMPEDERATALAEIQKKAEKLERERQRARDRRANASEETKEKERQRARARRANAGEEAAVRERERKRKKRAEAKLATALGANRAQNDHGVKIVCVLPEATARKLVANEGVVAIVSAAEHLTAESLN